ncbi:MAG: hypothetical protein HY403_02575 [Elusimicrobia bacterium]|nr:hypothetical protein [Elusimicrobiota bacterium]
MANNEDVPDQGVPAADIPDLKRKEKERKKAGAAWSGAKPGGGAFSGASGGTVARSAASAVGAAGGASGPSMLAGLTATVFGKALVGAGAAVFLAGAGLLGYSLLRGGGAGPTGVIGGDLGAPASSIRVRAPGGDRTGYVASKGEIRFEPVKAAEVKKEPQEQAAEEPAAPEQTADAAPGWNRPGLEHNLSGSKLSSSLGGGFGNKSIFGGGGSGPKLNDSFPKTNLLAAQKGRLSAARNAKTGRVVARGRGRRIGSDQALGQAIVLSGNNALGANATVAEEAHSLSAFEGQTGEGNVEGGPALSGPADTLGTGAPDLTTPNVTDPGGVAADPDTAASIAAIAAMAQQAGALKARAQQMMMMGLALIAAGIALLRPPTTPIGAALIGIGGMLVGMSIMMSQMAAMMKQMADTMSTSLSQRNGDINQDATNRYCIDRAYNEGTDPQNCNPPDSVTHAAQFGTSSALEVEQHGTMINENSQIEAVNGNPTGP